MQNTVLGFRSTGINKAGVLAIKGIIPDVCYETSKKKLRIYSEKYHDFHLAPADRRAWGHDQCFSLFIILFTKSFEGFGEGSWPVRNIPRTCKPAHPHSGPRVMDRGEHDDCVLVTMLLI